MKKLFYERGNIFGYNNLVVDTLNFQIMKGYSVPVILMLHTRFNFQEDWENLLMVEENIFCTLQSWFPQKIAGLFLEAHPNPDEAKCDGPCALRLDKLGSFLHQVKELDKLVKSQKDLDLK